MNIYLQGLMIGLAYLAPIGLQNLFVINAALTQSRGRVLFTALSVIFFDISLALSCFYGVGAVIQSSELLKLAVLLTGSIIIIRIGAGLVRAKEEEPAAPEKQNISPAQTIAKAFVVTWFNPQALIDGSMMLGAFRASLPAEAEPLFAGGFVSASVLWFLSLSFVISLFSKKVTGKVLRLINVLSGTVIIFYGLKLLYSFIKAVSSAY